MVENELVLFKNSRTLQARNREDISNRLLGKAKTLSVLILLYNVLTLGHLNLITPLVHTRIRLGFTCLLSRVFGLKLAPYAK